MIRRVSVALGLALLSCAGRREPAARPSDVHVVGVVRRAPPRVLLEAEGKTWVAAERSDPALESFDGKRVDVVGAPDAARLHVKTVRLVTVEPGASHVAAGPEVVLTGYFEDWTWPAGTKLAGEKALRFVTVDGRTFFVGPLPTDPPMGEPLTVRGRVVTPSPFLGGIPGEHLWVYDLHERD
jgi:hypothetical protein